MLRQRQLNENPIDRRVRIQLSNDGEQLRFARRRRQLATLRANTDLQAVAVLQAHVDLRSRIVADQHDREPWRPRPEGDAFTYAIGDLVSELRSDGGAIEDSGAH